jgi:L-alanine-DL-glutamate epimerase-like enolase superfamily enzyme
MSFHTLTLKSISGASGRPEAPATCCSTHCDPHGLAADLDRSLDLYAEARKSLHFVGYEGISMIAVAGVDMAAWDTLAKAADVPLCVLLGGSVGPVPSYNSNGLWLRSPDQVASEAVELRDEGGFRD